MCSSRMRTVSIQGGSLLSRGFSAVQRGLCQEYPPEGTWDQRQRLPPQKKHGTSDRDPLEETWARQRPPSEEPGSQTESDIIERPPDRLTDTSENITLPQTSFAGGNDTPF